MKNEYGIFSKLKLTFVEHSHSPELYILKMDDGMLISKFMKY